MINQLVVPVDGSQESWIGAEVAFALARRSHAAVTLLRVEFAAADRDFALRDLRRDLHAAEAVGIDVDTVVRIGDSVVDEIDVVLTDLPGAVLVMASHGRGRSSAVIGSVADGVLRRASDPVLLVGPQVEALHLNGPMLITVDGSDLSERAVPVGVSWAIDLRIEPWIVHTWAATTANMAEDVFEAAYVANLARDASRTTGHDVEFEELHGQDPATTVCDYARRTRASMIAASSHGRSGLARLKLGSVVSGFVRHAPCPVLVVREPRGSVGSPERPTTAAAS